jgi:Flp pilus assembly pilin Flp
VRIGRNAPGAFHAPAAFPPCRESPRSHAIEYGLIAAFIAVALVAALPSLCLNILGLFNDVDREVMVGRKRAQRD